MPALDTYFATPVYRADLSEEGGASFLPDIEAACRMTAANDRGGQAWCRKHGYPGYTSYASLDDLPWRFPAFKALAKRLDRHVAAFARHLEFDLAGRKLALDSIWINVLDPGGVHGAHIHPHSVVSGTFYVAVPHGASAIKFEDPRLGFMMAAPPRKARARPHNRTFAEIAPQPGTVLLWESWLRHEVPVNRAGEERISVSFNYAWAPALRLERAR